MHLKQCVSELLKIKNKNKEDNHEHINYRNQKNTLITETTPQTMSIYNIGK